MKKNTPQEISDILLGYLAGTQVQFLGAKQENNLSYWADCCGEPCWSFNTSVYRLKPEPRKIYAIEYSNGDIEGYCFTTHEEANLHCLSEGQSIIEYIESKGTRFETT